MAVAAAWLPREARRAAESVWRMGRQGARRLPADRRRPRPRPGRPVQRLGPRDRARHVPPLAPGSARRRGRWLVGAASKIPHERGREAGRAGRRGRPLVDVMGSYQTQGRNAALRSPHGSADRQPVRRDSGAGGPSPLIRAILAAPGAVRSLRLRRGLAARPRRPRRHASVARARARRVARGSRLRVSRAARPHGGAGAPRPPSPTGRAAAPEPEPAPSAARCRSPAAARAPACATPRAPTVRSPVSSSLSIATSTHPGRANVGAGAPVPRIR